MRLDDWTLSRHLRLIGRAALDDRIGWANRWRLNWAMGLLCRALGRLDRANGGSRAALGGVGRGRALGDLAGTLSGGSGALGSNFRAGGDIDRALGGLDRAGGDGGGALG